MKNIINGTDNDKSRSLINPRIQWQEKKKAHSSRKQIQRSTFASAIQQAACIVIWLEQKKTNIDCTYSHPGFFFAVE